MTLMLGDPAGAKRDSVQDMIKQICLEADFQVGADGVVITREADFCTRKRGTPFSHGCDCLCALIMSRNIVIIVIREDLSKKGGGRTDPANSDNGTNGNGSEAIVNIENRNRYRQRRRDTGEWMYPIG